MKKVCSIASVCLALLLTGCVSVRHKTPKPFYGGPSDQTVKVFSKNVLASRRNRNARFFLDKNVRPRFDLAPTTERSGPNMYFVNASSVLDQPRLAMIMSDGRFIPINEENERRSFEFSLEKSDPADFSEFENEFKDIQVDTQGKGVFDPLTGFNRLMYRFNDKLYFWVLKPVSKGYGKIVSEDGRIALKRFFKNLSFPVRFVNNVLQGKFKQTGIETLRFVMNSTLGILGISDPAYSLLNLQAYEEDFGQTLGHYGAGDGFPLVLPFLGPSNLRDAIGIIPDLFFYPIAFLDPETRSAINRVFLGVKIWEIVNRTSLRIGFYENLKKDALDPYTLMRDTYKQNRDAKIKE